MVRKLGAEAVAVRLPHQLGGLDGLIIPGGESTTMLKLMDSFGLTQPLRELAKTGFPMLGTCAGMVCLGKKVDSDAMEPLAVMDVVIKRNAFGRQIDSFEADLAIPVLGDKPFPAVFIRAPFIGEEGPQVEILARLSSGVAIAARQDNLVVSAFHPELTNDLRFHRYFLKLVSAR